MRIRTRKRDSAASASCAALCAAIDFPRLLQGGDHNVSPEFWAIVAATVALAGLIINGNRVQTARMDRMDARMDRIEAAIVALGERMAHLEGLLEGLREAIAHNRAA